MFDPAPQPKKSSKEAPSPFLDEKNRAAMGAEIRRAGQGLDYDSAGTVEFIRRWRPQFLLLGNGTRGCSVEHSVTELHHRR